MSPRKIGPWTVKSERSVFDNAWIGVEHHDVLHPDGTPGAYGVVKFKNLAVGILPVSREGDVWLVGQHRYPHDKYSWELPEGGGPLDVEPLASAKRELAEETGLTANEWAPLIEFDISNSVTDERAVCFLAWDLREGEANPEPSESLTLKRVKFEALLEMVMCGEITDSLTVAMTLKAHLLALQGGAPALISEALRAGRALR
ncbi:MAG: NUDIX hydrolase [Pseudomonadota bacterium]